jgi:hypothetical protein
MAVVAHLSGKHIVFEIDTTPFTDNRTNLEFEILSGEVNDATTNSTSYLPLGPRSGTVSLGPLNITYHQLQGRTVTINFQGVLLMSNLPWDTIPTNSLIQNVYVTLNRGGTATDDAYYDMAGHFFRYARVTQCRHTYSTDNFQVFEISFVANGTYIAPTATIS